MAVVYSQFALNQWKPSLTAAQIDKVKGTGMINSEAKLHAICFLASHMHKQVNIVKYIFALSYRCMHDFTWILLQKVGKLHLS